MIRRESQVNWDPPPMTFSAEEATVEEIIPTEIGEGEIVTLPETSRSPVPLVESPGSPVTASVGTLGGKPGSSSSISDTYGQSTRSPLWTADRLEREEM